MVKGGLRNNALMPEKVHEVNSYSTMSFERAQKIGAPALLLRQR